MRVAIIVIAILLITGLSSAQPWSETQPVNSKFHYAAVYYGQITAFMNADFSKDPHDIYILANVTDVATASPILQRMMASGKKVFLYFDRVEDSTSYAYGALFAHFYPDVDRFKGAVEWFIDYVAGENDAGTPLGTGVFFDEVEPVYYNPSGDAEQERAFEHTLWEVISYAHSKGLEVFINGVRYYASFGDWYLWESFATTWSGDVNSPTYSIVDFFAGTAGSEDLKTWIATWEKWYYLYSHGLMHKVIGHSYMDISNRDWVEYAYLMAMALGLGGLAFGYANNMAATGWELPAVPAGITFYRYVDYDSGILAFVSTSVLAMIDVHQSAADNTPHYYVQYADDYASLTAWYKVLDASFDDWDSSNSVVRTVTDESMDVEIVELADAWIYGYAYFKIKVKSSSDPLYNVYLFIDSDKDVSTGVQKWTWGGYIGHGTEPSIGAEVMLEYFGSTDGVRVLFSTSTDGSWSWADVYSLDAVGEGASYYDSANGYLYLEFRVPYALIGSTDFNYLVVGTGTNYDYEPGNGDNVCDGTYNHALSEDQMPSLSFVSRGIDLHDSRRWDSITISNGGSPVGLVKMFAPKGLSVYANYSGTHTSLTEVSSPTEVESTTDSYYAEEVEASGAPEATYHVVYDVVYINSAAPKVTILLNDPTSDSPPVPFLLLIALPVLAALLRSAGKRR